MHCLSVYLIQIQSYRAFSKMAVDHWCLSLRGLSDDYGEMVDNYGESSNDYGKSSDNY